MVIALSVLGATGKMGKTILELALKDSDFQIAGAGLRKGNEPSEACLKTIREQHENCCLSSCIESVLEKCSVVIDVSSQEAIYKHLEAAVASKKAIVIGTTGHSLEGEKAIEDAAKFIPVLFSPNFSLGVALCLASVAHMSKLLFNHCTIDIVETHHTDKKDSPSGTALAFAKAIGKGKLVREHESTHPREKEEIVIHSIRSGNVVGEHTLIFECAYEKIEIKHTAYSRAAFAQGALLGAKFLAKQSPGLYSLKDLFKSL